MRLKRSTTQCRRFMDRSSDAGSTPAISTSVTRTMNCVGSCNPTQFLFVAPGTPRAIYGLDLRDQGPLETTGAVSSVGSEHLVYTQRVGGSNPSPPTTRQREKHSDGGVAQSVRASES